MIGTEGHNSKHGSAILPDALRWLWRDYPKPIAKPAGGPRHYISNNIVLDADPDWELVSQGHKFTEGPAVDATGNVFFTDIPNSRVHKISSRWQSHGVPREYGRGQRPDVRTRRPALRVPEWPQAHRRVCR